MLALSLVDESESGFTHDSHASYPSELFEGPSGIGFGKGKRPIVRGGRYDREFRIAVSGRFGAER
jgi:hypothetical protein